MDSLLVPSSIQRIRAFLVEMCGMKVKPWASAGEMLAALHATLAARQSCDIFWTSLRGLLEKLAGDLKARKEAEPGAVIDNEVLTPESYAALLDEIRACLAKQTNDAGPPFRRLARGLSAPALGLLLLLGGVVTVGCDRTTMSAKAQDAAAPDAAQSDVARVQSDSGPDRATAQPDARPDVRPDIPYITLVDAPPAKSDVEEVSGAGLDSAAVTIRDIMNSCNIPEENQGLVLACLSLMQESWTVGLANFLAGKDCSQVLSALNCDYNSLYSQCPYYASPPAQFDPNQLPLCRPVLIYIGVSFV
jgi:hypothetical protein